MNNMQSSKVESAHDNSIHVFSKGNSRKRRNSDDVSSDHPLESPLSGRSRLKKLQEQAEQHQPQVISSLILTPKWRKRTHNEGSKLTSAQKSNSFGNQSMILKPSLADEELLCSSDALNANPKTEAEKVVRVLDFSKAETAEKSAPNQEIDGVKSFGVLGDIDALIDPEELMFLKRHQIFADGEKRRNVIVVQEKAERNLKLEKADQMSTPTPAGTAVNGASQSKKRQRLTHSKVAAAPLVEFPIAVDCARLVVYTSHLHSQRIEDAKHQKKQLEHKFERANTLLNSIFASIRSQIPRNPQAKDTTQKGALPAVRISQENDINGALTDMLEKTDDWLKRQRRIAQKSLVTARETQKQSLGESSNIRDGIPERNGLIRLPAGYHINGTLSHLVDNTAPSANATLIKKSSEVLVQTAHEVPEKVKVSEV